MNPREFLNQFVKPTIADWRADELDVRKAIIAICQLDILAERMILHQSPGIQRHQITQKRDTLAAAAPQLAIARDVHDTHKHGALSRRTAVITKGRYPERQSYGGALGESAVGEFPLGGGGWRLVVHEDDGRTHAVAGLIARCLDHWEKELERLGV